MAKITNIDLIFADEQGTDLNKYGITESNGLEKQVKLRRLANITQVGTPLNAINLNKIPTKINEIIAETNKVEIELDTGNHKPSNDLKVGGVFLSQIVN